MKKFEQLYYFSNERIPSALACTAQEIFMCEAFAEQGMTTALYYPKYRDIPYRTPREIFDFYDVTTPFSVTAFPTLLHFSKPIFDGRKRCAIPFIGGASVHYVVRRLCRKMVASQKLHSQAVIYARNVHSAYIFSQYAQKYNHPFKTVFEVHALTQHKPEHYFHFVLRNVDALICISDSLKNDLMKLGIDGKRILAIPDGVKAERLAASQFSKEKIRRKLNLPNDKPLILYTGQLFFGKGADVFARAAALRPHYQFVCVGGHGEYFKNFQQKYTAPNVSLTGFIEPAQVQQYQNTADVLVLPPTANHAISPYTSPLKLFEYMTTGVPVVASDLPVLLEVLTDEQNALLFKEGDEHDLVDKIDRLLADQKLAEKIAAKALDDVQHYTWSNRAKCILSFLEELQ